MTSVCKLNQGSLLLIWINFNPSMDFTYMDYKVWGEITYPFLNCNNVAFKVWEWISNCIPHFVMDVITYPWQYNGPRTPHALWLWNDFWELSVWHQPSQTRSWVLSQQILAGYYFGWSVVMYIFVEAGSTSLLLTAWWKQGRNIKNQVLSWRWICRHWWHGIQCPP